MSDDGLRALAESVKEAGGYICLGLIILGMATCSDNRQKIDLELDVDRSLQILLKEAIDE